MVDGVKGGGQSVCPATLGLGCSSSLYRAPCSLEVRSGLSVSPQSQHGVDAGPLRFLSAWVSGPPRSRTGPRRRCGPPSAPPRTGSAARGGRPSVTSLSDEPKTGVEAEAETEVVSGGKGPSHSRGAVGGNDGPSAKAWSSALGWRVRSPAPVHEGTRRRGKKSDSRPRDEVSWWTAG